ncbi:hypothetical protein [Chryseobacterium gallinarum]|uniref:Uncharacterized protein n=1 Tax=Chryseobacterium gallinarum TaxID=1324352 RepID=A0ABX6KSY5_CHRGL|nr:hypothetical protein [Chryseobacterium gallinarum]QIY90534.1 hypothetical protein FOB44_07590 [Chryseobacterium gallinarum]
MRIEKNSFKIVAILLFLTILFVCCIIAVQNPEKYTFVLLPSKYLVFTLSILGIIAIIYLYNFLLKIIFTKKAFFEVNEKGIYNGLGFTKEKLIIWNNIKEIDIINYKGILRVRIKLFNDKPFIENTDFATKFILRQTINDLKTPIIIDSVYLKSSFEVLSKAIFKYWEEYKKSL